MTERPKAYSYIRFSSPDQAKGDSYRRQREAAEEYCRASGLQLVSSREYSFFDKGRSAFNGRHLDDTGQLARFLKHVEQGDITPGSYLIVESLDRLSREKLKDALPRFLDLLNKGILIYTSADKRLYSSEYNELDLMISIIEMSRAHNESKIKADRVSKAWKNKQKEARENGKPLGAACPYWLKYVNGSYEEISERVVVIRQIFEMCCNGYGQRVIAKKLNELCIPVFGSSNRNRSGTWGESSVGKILSNRALLGEYQPTGLVDGVRTAIGDPIKDFFPRVISDEEYYSAQAAKMTRIVSRSTKQSAQFNVWQGLVKCGACGEPMHLVNKGKPPKGNKYLRCYGLAKGVCKSKQIRLERSELVFKEILAKVDSLSLIQDSQGKLQQDISVIYAREVEISARLKELENQLLCLGGKIPTTLVSVVSGLEEELELLRLEREKKRGDLQREKVINKEDFFKRLDLVTYEGRARANYLLKSLDVSVLTEADKDGVFYEVLSVGEKIFDVLDNGVLLRYLPHNRGSLEAIARQGDADAMTLIGEVLLDLDDHEKELLSKGLDFTQP